MKNSLGNGQAKELTCTTRGHELNVVGGLLEGMGDIRGRVAKGEKLGQLQ